MDKKTYYAILFSIFLLFAGRSYSQGGSITLQIFEPLPQIDLGSMVIQNDLKGAPKLFYVTITPANVDVYVTGTVLWDRQNGTGFRQVFEFRTSHFKAKNFYSDELGTSGLVLDESSGNSDITKEVLDIGKLTGIVRLQLNLYSKNGTFLSQTSKDIVFSNPSQTLTIITPDEGSTQPVGGIVARWNQINGVSKYRVKLNVRTSPGQSLEEALNSGTPLINNKEVGAAVTNVDLRTLLEREWLPGQELVLRVSAVIAGVSGGSELESGIVNFTIASTTSPTQKTALINLLSRIQNENLNQFISMLNNTDLNDIKFYDDGGNEITLTQFQNLLNSIMNSIVKVTVIN